MTREQSNNLLALALWAIHHHHDNTIPPRRRPSFHAQPRVGFPRPESAGIAGAKVVSVITDEAEYLNGAKS